MISICKEKVITQRRSNIKRLLTLILKRCAGHQNVTFYELDGFDHGDMAEPAHLLLLKYIRKDK